MEKILFFSYNCFFLPLLYIFFFIAQWFNPKIREGYKGRRKLWEDIEHLNEDLGAGEKIIFFHCASMGEAEQAKPLIEAINSIGKKAVVVVSFFTPSGFLNFLPIKSVRQIIYLPFDWPWNAKRFFNTLNIQLWIIVKHDIWPNHVKYAKKNNVPMFLIDANLPAHSRRLWPGIRQFYGICLKWFTNILPVSDEDSDRFLKLYPYPERLFVTGDTRYDQVLKRSKSAKENDLKLLVPFAESRVLVGGSVWPSDTALLIPALPSLLSEFPDLEIVLVPHEPDEENLSKLEKELNIIGIGSVRFSKIGTAPHGKVIVVDVIGILAHIYKYGTICYVGGGCGPGVHNVMEPAIMGKPVIFGPKHENSFEAMELIRTGGGFSVKSDEEFTFRVLHLLNNKAILEQTGQKAAGLIQEHIGATDRIMDVVRDYLP